MTHRLAYLVFWSVVIFLAAGFDVLAEVRERNLYWAPEAATVGAKKVDTLLNFIFYLTAAVFVLTQSVYIYYLVKYRRRPGSKAYYSHGNNTLEIIWTAIPTAIFLGLVIYSNRLWAELHSPAPEDSVRVDVVSYQFGWDMRYAGADGRLGEVDVHSYSVDNKFGLVPNDAAGDDDFSSTELVIPVNRPVHIYLHSRDVIHSFYVPQFRLYQAAVPGRTIAWVWFEPTRTGNFELACSQICGSGHYNMKAPIRVVSQEEFAKWQAGKIAAKAEEAKAAAAARALRTSTAASDPSGPAPRNKKNQL
ncbi:MAG: cytochrome c oxidase subunit II [Chthoniobacterales bacterium]|nr:cytochrome c oxidase subunit II [Chthoniobacterales bacterium]